MKTAAVVSLLAAFSTAWAWGQEGHATIAFIAQNFVSAATQTWAQGILDDTSSTYMASIASWADDFRSTTAGAFSAPFHFIDAQDNPPTSCNVNFARDCGASCVVSALANYTQRIQDGRFSATNINQALMFLVHFVGDIHQPLHDENLELGGNDISVTFNGTKTNLHAIWDTNMIEKLAGTQTLPHAQTLANTLTTAIKTGIYSSLKAGWVAGLTTASINSTANVETTTTAWAAGATAFVCSTVMPNGVAAVENVDLSGAYYTKAIPVVEQLLATAGYRLAAWLNLIATGTTGGL
jgi:hypothetical protein